MAKKNKAQIEFQVATQGFREGIKEMNAGIRSFSNELKLNAEQLKGSSDNVELLQQRQGLLQQELSASNEKINLIGSSLKQAEELLGKNSKEYYDLTQSLTKARTEQEKIKNEIQSVNEKIQDSIEKTNAQENANVELKNSYQKLQSEIEDQKERMQNLKNEYSNVVLETSKNSKEAKELKKEIETLSSQLKKNESELKKVDNAAEEVSGSFHDAAESALDFGDILAANLASDLITEGLGAIKEGISSMTEDIIGLGVDSQKSLNTLAAGTNATKEELKEMGESVKDIYRSNFGDSMEGIAQTMLDVKHITGQMGDELKESTKSAMILADTFDMDIGESVRGADALMYQWGMDSQSAFDLLAAGAREGLNYTDELGDNISEYAGNFAQAGYSAEEYFQLLKNGTDNGAYNLDKVNDAINEVTNRLADGTIEGSMSKIDEKTGKLVEGTAKWSEGTENIFKKWQAGEATQKEVIDSIVNDIRTCTNEQDALTMAATAFGTMGEDSNLKFVESLTSVGDTFKDTKGTIEEINEVKYDNLESAMEGIKRNIELDVLEPIEGRLLPALSNMANSTDFEALGDAAAGALDGILDGIAFVAEHQNVFIPIAAGIGGVVGAAGIASAGMAIYNGVLDIMALNAGTATVATTGLGAAFTLVTSPISLVVLGIGALIAIGVALYQNWDTIKEKAGEVGAVIEEKWEGAKNAVTTKASDMKQAATEKYEEIKQAALEKTEFMRVGIKEKLGKIEQTYTEHGGGVRGIVAVFMDEVEGYYSAKFSAIDKLTGGKLSGIADKFNEKMGDAKRYVKEGIDKIKGFFDFSWELPKLKLPHFTASGKFSLNPLSVPKFDIDWYAKGALFTEPTIIPANGFGEAGHEYALPLNKLSLAPLANMLGEMIIDRFNTIQTIDYDKLDRIIGNHSKKEYVFKISRRELLRVLEEE